MDKNWIFIKDSEFALIIKALKFGMDNNIFDQEEVFQADDLKCDLEDNTNGTI